MESGKDIFKQGVSLLEVVISISLIATIASISTISFIQFRNTFVQDFVLESIVESVNYTKMRALASEIDSNKSRNSFSIIFFTDRFIEFEGDTYYENGSNNYLTNLPNGFSLSSNCSPENNGIITFESVTGINLNECTIHVLKSGRITSTIVIGKYGIEKVY